MAGWRRHEGQAVRLPLANVDTDQLIPARFMSVPRAEGYGRYLLHDLRRDESGVMRRDFPLNTVDQASVLVAGANFGSGSSREAAVYALVDAGFRVVFAPSFGDIFASNAVNNGLLPARIDADTSDALAEMLVGFPCKVQIDLGTCRATFGNHDVPFTLDENWRIKLMNGWDDIDLTQQHAMAIDAFRERYAETSPWTVPRKRS
ncbi:3-isopropylmalate dehydratase small subunit [uncultured Sulfitobacter sp.]|uniref:3-isopropylmalate dehydratase small subunit n=1 Tax=uncultured Sulfitobacter sp. TaxID=191468 RepID=UPI002608B716|nr:3-isopropylmalate dehydratase small subunit [uncultured Sulfitobacter sp.]